MYGVVRMRIGLSSELQLESHVQSFGLETERVDTIEGGSHDQPKLQPQVTLAL